jgi:5,10-methylenetetrahydromethanopterin reductase
MTGGYDVADASVLGAYILPGSAMDPLGGIAQAVEGERVGLGSVWLSELQGPLKDAGAICGAAGQATTRVAIGTSITHFGTRHPMVLASWGLTMQVLTGGRFRLGFGRSTPSRWRDWGVPIPTIESMEDSAAILRKLWAGESVTSDGPAGHFPHLDFGEFPDVEPPPLLLAAIGPRTLELAGRAFDGVLLHPFLTPDAVARSREVVRAAAKGAGRDPDAVAVYHQLVTAPDLSDDEIDRVVRSRAAFYFSHPGFGEAILGANGWDQSHLETLRAAALKAATENAAAGSPLKGRDVLIEPSRTLPEEWFSESAAIGTAEECASRLRDFLAAGADQIVVHGTTPDALERTVKAFAS